MVEKKTVKKEKTEEFDIKEIYTPLSVAKKEIWRRWNDPVLRKKVEDFLGGDVPDIFNDNPRACLGRNIASPNFESKYFIKLAKDIGLRPVFIEHKNDKFVSHNLDKYHLGRLYFYNGMGRNGGSKLNVINVVDFNKCQGKIFSKINTVWGENFIDFHRRIFKKMFPNDSVELLDISCVLKNSRKGLSKCYHKYLVLFIYGGILFENFLFNKKGEEFTHKVVIPAFKLLKKEFGLKPLIVPLAPIEDEVDLYWFSYPESLREFVQVNSRKKSKK